jgi:hypothetical protein
MRRWRHGGGRRHRSDADCVAAPGVRPADLDGTGRVPDPSGGASLAVPFEVGGNLPGQRPR